MTQNVWANGVESMHPYIFRIRTQQGSGTGFLMFSNSKGLVGVATALHVISHESEWELPIRLVHYSTNINIVLQHTDRAIIPYHEKDLAIILFNNTVFDLPNTIPNLVPPGQWVRPGVEIGWIGFPSIANNGELCFFAGYTSTYLESRTSYLIDGVAINGVSGGPAFIYDAQVQEVMICGVVSGYIPNRTTGEVLPGMCFVSSIEPYQPMLESFRSLADAEKKAEEKQETFDSLSSEKPPKSKKKISKVN